MTCTKFILPPVKFGCTIMAVVNVIGCPALVVAQPTQPIIRIQFTEKPDGSSRGRPNRSGGTGTRGDCPPQEIPLTALVPASNLILTVNNPTFWFYVPYKSDRALSGEFSLQDERNNDVYRSPFTLAGTPGIVSISLPSTQSLLDIGKHYSWYFKIYCLPQASSELSSPAFVQGWVQRVSLKSQVVAGTDPLERIALYAENGIWQETLTGLANLRLTEPRNINIDNNWVELLRTVGLERLFQAPIIGAVKTNYPIERRGPNNMGFRNSRNGH